MQVPQLVSTMAIALSAALVFGYLARRIGLSPIVGYLVAGIAVGPHTPGLVADLGIASELAEIGVALLMFGVGLHFSPTELASVRSIAVPGALVQGAIVTLLGVGVGVAWGWGIGGGLVLGLAVSVASTVVVVHGLTDRGSLDTPSGRAAVGWLIVEDLITVVILVVLPTVAVLLGAPGEAAVATIAFSVALTLGKVGLLLALVLVVGRRAVPWLLDKVAAVQSRELFTLAVLGIALGIACGAAWLSGISLALGAFMGGMVVGQSDLSHQAAADSIPLRDAFAVLFFVSVGMLFDPWILLDSPVLLLVTLGIVVVAKPLVAVALVVGLGYPLRMALTIAAGRAQVGEFSFVMARLGDDLGLLPQAGHDVVLAAALVSITINPILFRTVEPLDRWMDRQPRLAALVARLQRRRPLVADPLPEGLADHVILCGSGRVGTVIGRVLEQRGWEMVVIESDRNRTTKLRQRGLRVVDGDAASHVVLDHARVHRAALLVLTFTDQLATRLAIDHARRVNPALAIIARVSSRTERDRLEALPGVTAVMGEFEAALEMARRALVARGLGTVESEVAMLDLRRKDRGDQSDSPVVLVEVPVPEGSPVVGRSVAELSLPPAMRLVVVRRGRDELIARGETVLEVGDLLLVLSDGSDLDALHRLIGGSASGECS